MCKVVPHILATMHCGGLFPEVGGATLSRAYLQKIKPINVHTITTSKTEHRDFFQGDPISYQNQSRVVNSITAIVCVHETQCQVT